MVNQQPALGSAILWGDGTVSAKGIVLNGSCLWGYGAKVGMQGVLNLTVAKWYSTFLDPLSINDAGVDILAHGNAGLIEGLKTGPPGAWFYPAR